jgi:hypothetical protein
MKPFSESEGKLLSLLHLFCLADTHFAFQTMALKNVLFLMLSKTVSITIFRLEKNINPPPKKALFYMNHFSVTEVK